MSDLALNWLRRNPRIQGFTYAVNTTRAIVMGRDPQRYAISIPSDSTNPIYYWLGPSSGTNAFLALQPNAGPLVLTEDDLGGYVTEPLWVYSSASCPPWTFLSIGYEPREFEIMRRMQRELISKLESS